MLDHFFDWRQMGADIVKRPYITVGMTALVLHDPARRHLDRRRDQAARRRADWQRLHRLAYVIGVCAVLHYLWLAKKANPDPYYYAAVFGLLWRSAAGTGRAARGAERHTNPLPERGSRAG